MAKGEYLIWGKHKSRRDYLSIGGAHKSFAPVTDWLEAGIEALHRAGLDMKPSAMWSLVVFEKKKIMLGIIAESGDAQGRQFPLLAGLMFKRPKKLTAPQFMQTACGIADELAESVKTAETANEIENYIKDIKLNEISTQEKPLGADDEKYIKNVCTVLKSSADDRQISLNDIDPSALNRHVRAAALVFDKEPSYVFFSKNNAEIFFRQSETGDFIGLFNDNKRDWQKSGG